ncbi:MAG: ABC transporter permease [Bacteroidetes bacterium]|nr:ABC transporter permease [Bacteroidota bacterium]
MESIEKIESNWTEVIAPRRGIFDINLSQIWHYRDLIALFVRRDFVSVYKQTILGPLWLFIQPLFTTFTFLFVFNRIAKIPTDGVPPVLFYLSGITLWTYFSDCFTKTSNTFVVNAGIFGKVYFPRLVSPISIIFSNLIKLAIQGSLLLAVLVYYMVFEGTRLNINVTLFSLPFLIVLMALLGLGLGIVFSSLTTKYRDLAFLLQFGVQLLLYATPVIYPLSYTTGKMKQFISLNPLTPIIESFRHSIFGIGQFDIVGLGYATLFTFIVLIVGVVVFNQVEKSFMDTV